MKISSAWYVDLLERLVARLRRIAVDQPARGITFVALGLGVVALLAAAAVFLSAALFRLLAIGVGDIGAYAIAGGLFLAVGWLFWYRRRIHPPEDEEEND